MPRYLWLLRHAKTLTEPPPGGADRDRRLAPRGERDAEALAKRFGPDGRGDRKRSGGKRANTQSKQAERSVKLPRLGSLPRPALILSSSAARAAQTTQVIAAQMVPVPTVRYLESLYAASPEEVMRQVSLVDGDEASLMVVGHNPTFEMLAVAMCSDDDRAGRKELVRRSLPTCALAVYEIPAARWREIALGTGRLVGLFTPPY